MIRHRSNSPTTSDWLRNSMNLVKNVFVLLLFRRRHGRRRRRGRGRRCRKSEPRGAILFVNVSLLQNIALHRGWRLDLLGEVKVTECLEGRIMTFFVQISILTPDMANTFSPFIGDSHNKNQIRTSSPHC